MVVRGRFAPSPTGLLHFGSLLAAVGSYLNVKSRGGEWLVRIEDLDPPREQADAARAILRTLDALGLEWDGPVLYQSQREECYLEALAQLRALDLTYHCTCSRKDIAAGGLPGIESLRYPGTCRTAAHKTDNASIRLITPDAPLGVEDRLQGRLTQQLESEIGDFIIRRRDGLFAYQIAVVVDDADQGVTEVVRGCDLLDSTPRQVYLQQLLDLRTPAYLHLPVAVDTTGNKLSKQTGAEPIDTRQGCRVLLRALEFLGQRPPADLLGADVGEIMEWGKQNWSAAQIPVVHQIPYEE